MYEAAIQLNNLLCLFVGKLRISSYADAYYSMRWQLVGRPLGDGQDVSDEIGVHKWQ